MTDCDALGQLYEAWLSARQAVTRQWDRTLPFGEYVVDRWKKAQFLGFGEGASIYDSAIVLGTVSVGAHTWIGPWVMLDGTGGLSVGSYCSFSPGVQIHSHDSVKWETSGGKSEIERGPTHIGNSCYIGPNVIIAKGVMIGDYCIIGANRVVLSDVPTGMKAFGNPCRPVCVTSFD